MFIPIFLLIYVLHLSQEAVKRYETSKDDHLIPDPLAALEHLARLSILILITSLGDT